jgi:hypothetical protein
MWIFGLYELLRTWRQQVRELINYASEANDANIGRARRNKGLRMKNITDIRPEMNVNRGYYESAMERTAIDSAFVEKMRQCNAAFEPLFKRIEALRMTLAKHEVPKTSGVYAAAPGYGRIDMLTGSIYWTVDYKDGYSDIVPRRSIARGLRRTLLELETGDRLGAGPDEAG